MSCIALACAFFVFGYMMGQRSLDSRIRAAEAVADQMTLAAIHLTRSVK